MSKIHYGPLEDRLTSSSGNTKRVTSADMELTSSIPSEANASVAMEFERRKRAKSFPIPTEDAKVR